MAKCADCGYLAAKDCVTKQLFEVDPIIRDAGKYTDILGREHPTVLFCFVGKRQFTDDELGEATRKKLAIQKEIECSEGFIPYCQGRDAKEHEEMSVIEAVRAQSAKLEEELRAERVHAQRDREQAAQDRKDSVGKEDLRDKVARSRFWWSQVLPALAGIAAAILAVVVAEFVKH